MSQNNALDIQSYRLFEVVGIELEYMIVDTSTLDVKPLTDKLLFDITGEYLTEVSCGRVSYSNELALHVVELKTTDPEKSLDGLADLFQEHVQAINNLLHPYKAKLLPTGCHPWMNPDVEMKLWPHERSSIYEAYNRLFDCRGHGWANLQSAHINLPFANDKEFYNLHAACRILLPLLPAIAASSPIMDGKVADKLDKRLDVYRYNQKRFPIITGDVIPEIITSKNDYENLILAPIFKEVAPHDFEGVLQHEWLNSRGCIARFERNTIEIRVLDIQECPRADIAIAKATIHTLKNIINELWTSFSLWNQFSSDKLVIIYNDCVARGDLAIIDDVEYLKLFGLTKPLTALELWRYLLTDLLRDSQDDALEVILREGPLARRILKAYKKQTSKEGLHFIYNTLSSCLEGSKMFHP